MGDPDEPVFIIPRALFDYWAEKEGQVEDGYAIHSVDRVAGTLRVGAQLLKVVELIPCELGTIDRFQIHQSTPEDMAQHNLSVVATVAPRGAQWKREANRHRRAR